MNLVGKKYIPIDNSYCINTETGKEAHIVPGYCDEEELHSIFEIISEPYKEEVYFVGYRIHTFIDIKSGNTGKIYRTLYLKQGVVEDNINN